MKHVALVLMMCVPFLVHAQQSERERTLEFLRQEEQRKQAAVMRQMDSAVHLMDEGLYTLADEKFRYVLNNLRSIPSELTFYFGKNSFYLEKYSQSVDWLNKYIQLRGTGGRHYEETVSLLSRAEVELLKSREEELKRTAEVLSTSYDIDCGPTGKVSCPVCMGNHVIRKPGPFGPQYKTCPYCDEHGALTCVEYNQLLRGQLEPKR